MSFENLNLMKSLLQNIGKAGYLLPTEIQQQSIPLILAGKDLFGCAQTGTGKTAAFALPIIHKLLEERKTAVQPGIGVLVVAPTRELALQIHDSFSMYGEGTGLRYACVYGGVSQNGQVSRLKSGVDILVATPGRLLDLVDQKLIRLDAIRYFVLDEADRMLDMGFIHDIKRIIALLPRKRQNLFFAATLTPLVKKLAAEILVSPVMVSATPDAEIPDLISQSVYYVRKEDKRGLLRHVMQRNDIGNALVFTRTKHGADRVARDLNKNGITAAAIHGDKAQNNRERSLRGFRTGDIRVLVATDVVSRGIDIDQLSHVINFEIPQEPATYIHRIGRTGRAGSNGTALSFCSDEEKQYLADIRKEIRKEIQIVREHPYS